LSASDAWRKKNLRYYPWYGRGHVQLTWEDNYRRADRELGLGGTLVENADRALEPDISVKIMIRGMVNGWFSGDANGRHTLQRHLPNGAIATREQFRQARRIVNLMDRADLIAGHAMIYQEALRKAGY
jgi:putative chitinase